MGPGWRRRGLAWLSAALTFLCIATGVAYVCLTHPNTPLPPEWNPTVALDVAAPATPVTRWKLARAQEGSACFAALATADADYAVLPDLEQSENCHIRERVRITRIGSTALAPLETRCATALRLALWVRHGLVPAARDYLGSDLARLHHLSSYSCRPVRLPSGAARRMSTHATADAIDVTGVSLSDGRRIDLIDAWNVGANGQFLKVARDSACGWFATTLGPDYNALHADHFHLQTRGWGLCR
jgi:hypothetical protein